VFVDIVEALINDSSLKIKFKQPGVLQSYIPYFETMLRRIGGGRSLIMTKQMQWLTNSRIRHVVYGAKD
jgi:hypothetical protein